MSDSIARKLPAANTILNPPGWPQPKGYANGVKARGEMVFVGGMIGWDTNGVLPKGFVAQTKQLLENIVAVLKEGGAGPEHVVRMTWYVTDIEQYRNSPARTRQGLSRGDGPQFRGDGAGAGDVAGREGRAAGDRDHGGDPGLTFRRPRESGDPGPIAPVDSDSRFRGNERSWQRPTCRSISLP